MHHLLLPIAGPLVLASVLASCSSTPPAAVPATSAPEPEAVPLTYAMTGTQAPDGWRPRPVVVIKVDNTTDGRPQLGVDSADLVIEEPVEGGLTRLATFFESELPETVGPVRSVRISDIGLVDPVRATVVASGGAPDSLAAFEKAGVTLVTEGSPALGRDSTRPAPYNLFADPSKIDRLVKGTVPPKPYFDFGTPDLAQGARAERVTLTFSPSRSETWQAAKKGWRSSDTGYAADTIVVLTVKTRDTGERDAAGSPIPEVISTGRGAGFLLTEGQVHQIRWSKRTPSAAWRFTTPAGLSVPIPPGRTWVALMEQTGQVDFD